MTKKKTTKKKAAPRKKAPAKKKAAIKKKAAPKKVSRPLNLVRDPSDLRDFRLPLLLRSEGIATQKEKVSWKDFMSPVKDQGQKGSCVGFACAAMKEWQEANEHSKEVAEGKTDHRKGKVYDLSEQWIYHMCKEIDLWPGQEGTSIRVAMKVLNRIGCPPEDGWPYRDTEVGKPKSWAPLVSQWNKVGSYYRASTVLELIDGLSLGPVVIGVPVFADFFDADKETGWIKMPKVGEQVLGGHAICIVGYDPADASFEFKNSWSKRWGNQGYGKLSYEYLNKYLWDAWVAVDLAVRGIPEGTDIPEIEDLK